MMPRTIFMYNNVILIIIVFNKELERCAEKKDLWSIRDYLFCLEKK